MTPLMLIKELLETDLNKKKIKASIWCSNYEYRN